MLRILWELMSCFILFFTTHELILLFSMCWIVFIEFCIHFFHHTNLCSDRFFPISMIPYKFPHLIEHIFDDTVIKLLFELSLSLFVGYWRFYLMPIVFQILTIFFEIFIIIFYRNLTLYAL